MRWNDVFNTLIPLLSLILSRRITRKQSHISNSKRWLENKHVSHAKISSDPESQCRAHHQREFNQLELAIRWNRLDLAEEHLFKGKQFSTNQLNELLWIALEHKNIHFVSSIMTKGANFKQYLTVERFWTYLNSKAFLNKSPLRKLMKMHLSVNRFPNYFFDLIFVFTFEMWLELTEYFDSIFISNIVIILLNDEHNSSWCQIWYTLVRMHSFPGF